MTHTTCYTTYVLRNETRYRRTEIRMVNEEVSATFFQIVVLCGPHTAEIMSLDPLSPSLPACSHGGSPLMDTLMITSRHMLSLRSPWPTERKSTKHWQWATFEKRRPQFVGFLQLKRGIQRLPIFGWLYDHIAIHLTASNFVTKSNIYKRKKIFKQTKGPLSYIIPKFGEVWPSECKCFALATQWNLSALTCLTRSTLSEKKVKSLLSIACCCIINIIRRPCDVPLVLLYL